MLTVVHIQSEYASPDDDIALNEGCEEDPSMLDKARSALKGIASGLRTVLKVTKEVSEGLPPLKGAVSGLLAVLEVYEV